MRKFKYKISDDGDQDEIWVCEACKKVNNHDILTGKWKLIDRSESDEVACEICGKGHVSSESSSDEYI